MSKILLVSLVHNRKHLIGDAIISAYNQTLSKNKFIHLLVDNASTDGADKVCEFFVSKYNHLKLIKMPENLGQQKAFNFVLYDWIPKNTPNAQILCNLDSDDKLTTNALEEVEKMFDTYKEIGQTYSGFSVIDRKGNIKIANHPKAKMVLDQFSEAGQKRLRQMFIRENPIGHLRAFRIKCLLDIGGFNTNYQYSTDYNAAGRMLEKYPVVKINKVLYLWRQHDSQVERQHSPQQTLDWKNMQKEFKDKWTKDGII